jgi:hypothetical protein
VHTLLSCARSDLLEIRHVQPLHAAISLLHLDPVTCALICQWKVDQVLCAVQTTSCPCTGGPDQAAPTAPGSPTAGDGSRGAQDARDSSEDTATSRCTAAGGDRSRQVSWAADIDQMAAGADVSSQETGAEAAAGPFRFSEAALAAAGVRDAAFIPAVVAGEALSEEHGAPWPLRRCRLGPPLEALNPEHSDLLQLK